MANNDEQQTIDDLTIDDITKGQKINKWWILASGIMFGILGYYFIKYPVDAIISTIFYFAFLGIFSGIFGIVAYCKKENEGTNLVLSIINLLFGILLLASGAMQATFLVMIPYMLAVWALIRGILIIVNVVQNKGLFKNWVLAVVGGALSIFACLIIIKFPIASTFTIELMLGILMIIAAISLIIEFFYLQFKKTK